MLVLLRTIAGQQASSAAMEHGVVERSAAADRSRRSDRTLDLVLDGVLTSRD